MPATRRATENRIDLRQGLVCFWPLDEASGNRYDDGPNAYTLTDTGSVPSAAGQVYTLAADFDMLSDMCLTRTLANSALVNFGPTNGFTLAAWCYPTAFTGGPDSPAYYRHLFSMCGGGYSYGGYRLFTSASGQIVFTQGSVSGLGTNNLWHSAHYCVLDTWQLVIAAYHAPTGQITCRLNTTEDIDVNANAATFAAGAVGAFYVGSYNATQHVYDGRIGPAMIWRRVLTPAEMDALYRAGRGLTFGRLR